jgi:predicted HicB family RNase H-like nuclease
MEPQTAKLASKTQDEFSAQLEKIVKDFTSEINYCQEQSNLWQERKKSQQNKMAEVLQQIQRQCGIEPQKPMPASKKEATVSQLIRTFLESNGPARPRDIRRFLLNQGRTTNPGVALGRLVAEGVLKNTERGVYSVS